MVMMKHLTYCILLVFYAAIKYNDDVTEDTDIILRLPHLLDHRSRTTPYSVTVKNILQNHHI